MKPKITGSIRINGRRFRAGDEAELQSVLTRTQHDELQKRGLITGEWEVSGAGEAGSTPGNSLEEAAALISARYGIERSSDENGAQFLDRLFAEPGGAELPQGDTAQVEGGGTPTEPLLALKSLGLDVVGELVTAGYDTPDAVAAASDKDLEALPGIGEATIKKIRALLK